MYDEDFNEDLADAVREGSLTECPHINKIVEELERLKIERKTKSGFIGHREEGYNVGIEKAISVIKKYENGDKHVITYVECNGSDECLDSEKLKKKIIQYKEVDGYLEQYIDGVFKHRIEKPVSVEPFSIK